MRILTSFIMALALLGGAVGCTRRDGLGGTPLDVKGLHVELPAGWRSVPPASSMRAAQAIIDGPGGPAELAVFHFGAGQGGDIEANIQRWLAQITPQAGTAPKREVFDAEGGLRINWVDAEGTLSASPMGMGPATPVPDSRLMGAVIEGDGGPWFFKVIGPDLTLAGQRLAFRGMLQRARPMSQ
jgi:hypothetical protein